MKKGKMPIRQNEIESTKAGTSIYDRSKYTFDIVNNWIINADSKISASCGIITVVIAALVFVADNFLSDFNVTVVEANKCFERVFYVFAVIGLLAFLTSLAFHFWALSPNLFSGEKKKSHSDKQHVEFSIFFNEIKDFTNEKEYADSACGVTEELFTKEILKEIYYNSVICANKMQRLKIGIWAAFISILSIVAASIVYYCMYS